jgi:biopolymer transport protein ExbD
MAGSTSHIDDGKKKARIEIIPLIDVIFFLLATFVLFTLSLNKIVSIDVQLPAAVPNTDSKPDEDLVTLQVSDTGVYYWKVGTSPSEQLQLSDIAPRLQQLSQNTNARVLVAGDNLAKFGAAVNVLDEVRKVGIKQVSVETTNNRPTGK